jgi:Ca2+-binding RTX toxin-like protein
MRIASTAIVGLLAATVLIVPAGPAVTAAAPACKGRAVTILGTDGDDNLRGTNKRDVVLALGGDDRIDGRGGNDVICGGSGRDLIQGGSGADKIFGGADGRSTQLSPDGVPLLVGDVVQGGPGDDLIDLGYDERQQTLGSAQRDRLSYKGSAFRVIVTLGSPKGRGHAQGDGRDLLVSHPFLALLGSDRGDLLTGSTYGDEILGRGGADVIDGGAGRDVLVDGPLGSRVGDDELVGGVGRDTLTSYGGHDRLVGDSSADTISVVHAAAGATEVVGGPGGDLLTVSALQSGSCVKVDGGAGGDELVPTVTRQVHRGKVDADLRSGPFGVRVRGRDGCGSARSVETLTIDNAFGSAQRLRWFVEGSDVGEYVLLRHGGSVRAVMHGGRDQVIGSGGDDTLKGGPGGDRLFGGAGKDVAIGGPGNDTCRKVEFRKGCEVPAS